jgi:SAM-dependent methyltransferase
MNYINKNKEAWEEAYNLRREDWCENILNVLKTEKYPYLEGDMPAIIDSIDLRDKCIAQFCCNDGRELLSIVKNGAKYGVGFDIAENMVAHANHNAKESSIPCNFVATNILEISEEYNNTFDILITTIGALCWFQSLEDFFQVAARVLKRNGQVIVQDMHPFTNMIAFPGESSYDPNNRLKVAESYFKTDAWVNNSGMYYLTGKEYESKEFTDYPHTVSDLITGMTRNGILITDLREYDFDLGGSLSEIVGLGYPLSILIQGKKL